MSDTPPILLWLRRDLRLSDAPALSAACESGAPVIPVYIRDSLLDGLGAAPKWRLGRGLEVFGKTLEAKGSRLILRSGDPLDVLAGLVETTGAKQVFWTRLYDPESIARDSGVKEGLKAKGIDAKSFSGTLLFEPWEVETKDGGPYKVYSPFWRTVKKRDVAAPSSAPKQIPAPDTWPESEALDDWDLGRAMNRGAAVVERYAEIGEDAAGDRLAAFLEEGIDDYKAGRDRLAEAGTSGMSVFLTTGEIGPRTIWHAGMRALHEGSTGAETFLSELAWREFAWHLAYHTPRILDRNWREKWDAFPWEDDERKAEVKAWKQARTGVPLVDAGMREMQVTGTMHNRARMITASYLTKHLMVHWRVGQHWFDAHLIDRDAASNAMGWQWVAGSGPDASPFFRVFNPETQQEKFDPEGAYVRRWIAEGQDDPPETALDYFEAIPRRWARAPEDAYPDKPIVGLSEGRERALDAYGAVKD
ncbi:cryptochrome/photolyase family protein [Tropicimonas isoalkanivorans]|uniref:Deoxyribodipyrimidine photo-lyase n=1 Tax=Tropicimonas isoalkanivorans TaxID=441112 RepID=A0A1I1DJ05_9RHOB|nr:deoxyribodipyrimidine photo-lyase [Tropicimonas isoalkanivorans]SFB74847.1 deoxyribodipyrimidine photo-lyase [Tropicimonas isoalkanivorans]